MLCSYCKYLYIWSRFKSHPQTFYINCNFIWILDGSTGIHFFSFGGGGIRPSLPECCLPLEVKLPFFFSMVKVQFPSAKSVSAQVMWSIRRWHENAPEVVSESKFKVTYISLLSPLDNISKWKAWLQLFTIRRTSPSLLLWQWHSFPQITVQMWGEPVQAHYSLRFNSNERRKFIQLPAPAKHHNITVHGRSCG